MTAQEIKAAMDRAEKHLRTVHSTSPSPGLR
jgi:hypothetical protein